MTSSDFPSITQYYANKAEEARAIEQQKHDNLVRLEAQHGELNRRVRLLREEMMKLLEPGSVVGEVVKVMRVHGKLKCLVKAQPEGKYVVDIKKKVRVAELKPQARVALRSATYELHVILPLTVDPIVSLMKMEKVPDATYDQIGGLAKQIREIREVVELPIKHPELFSALGISQPKGVIMFGPPGTGKTLLARAVAHHTNCHFIRLSGSELVQKYIGEGARMVRELFVRAREKAPSLIFMDEIDSIGSSRGDAGGGSGDSEVQRTMMELLNQLDGFEPAANIKVLMATNRIDILDDALLRPGRIDRKIEFPAPDAASRVDILKIHSRRMNLVRSVRLSDVAAAAENFSGAELRGVIMEAGMFAVREARKHVTQEDLMLAVAKVKQRDDAGRNISRKQQWK